MGGSAAAVADLGAIFGGGAAAAGAGAVAADVAYTGWGAVTAADVASGAVTAEQALAAGVSASDLVAAGTTGEQLAQAGLTADQIAQAGGTAAQIQGAAAGASTPFQLADGTMGSISGGNILDASGNVVAQGGTGGTLGQLAGYAKTGAQLIGGIGQLGQAGALLGGGQTKPGVADPYAQYRSQAAGQLQNLLADPNTITSTPGYQFNLQQGLQAQQAQQAAQGRLVSGGGLLQAQQFGQQYAQSSLSQQESLLATLSGANQAPAGAAQAQQGINFGQAGAGALGLQQLASGASNVLNPLQTLYSQYNQSSPSVT